MEINVVRSFKEITDKVLKDVETVIRVTGLEAFSRIIKMTPVESGRARGNWQVSFDKPKSNVLNTKDKTGSKSITKASTTLGKFSILSHKGIYLTNNIPYIQKLEYGWYPNPPKKGTGKTVGGFSKQAAQGMVRVTLQAMAPIFKEAMNKI